MTGASLPNRPDAEPVVVLGGGRLGSAVARRASAEGRAVLVASRRARPHTGLWVRWTLGQRLPPLVVGARVVIAIEPADAEPYWRSALPTLTRELQDEGAATVVICGPIDTGALEFERGRHPSTSNLRFSALVGPEDGCLWPLITAVRESGVVRIPRSSARFAPLLFEDAARAALSVAPGEARVALGSEWVTLETLAQAVVARFGGRLSSRWFSRNPALPRGLAPQEDGWNPSWGARTSVLEWINRLPGLRVRPREDSSGGH